MVFIMYPLPKTFDLRKKEGKNPKTVNTFCGNEQCLAT